MAPRKMRGYFVTLLAAITPATLGQQTSAWPTAAPGAAWRQSAPITVGTRFRSDIKGTITGIRFYSSAANTGPRIGLLYSNTGTELGRATFDAQTASGWQQVSFPEGIPIQANTLYVAAVFTTGYSYTATYYSTTDSNPDGIIHPVKGMYSFSTQPQFPATALDTNFWVDVVFAAAPAAVIPPPLTNNSIQISCYLGTIRSSQFNPALNQQDFVAGSAVPDTFRLLPYRVREVAAFKGVDHVTVTIEPGLSSELPLGIGPTNVWNDLAPWPPWPEGGDFATPAGTGPSVVGAPPEPSTRRDIVLRFKTTSKNFSGLISGSLNYEFCGWDILAARTTEKDCACLCPVPDLSQCVRCPFYGADCEPRI